MKRAWVLVVAAACTGNDLAPQPARVEVECTRYAWFEKDAQQFTRVHIDFRATADVGIWREGATTVRVLKCGLTDATYPPVAADYCPPNILCWGERAPAVDCVASNGVSLDVDGAITEPCGAVSELRNAADQLMEASGYYFATVAFEVE